ncbi:MAG: hypothetical protein ACI88A_003685, partial [Paraglaciecola sp.]
EAGQYQSSCSATGANTSISRGCVSNENVLLLIEMLVAPLSAQLSVQTAHRNNRMAINFINLPAA